MESPCFRGHPENVGHVISRPSYLGTQSRGDPQSHLRREEASPELIQSQTSYCQHPTPVCIVWHVKSAVQQPIRSKQKRSSGLSRLPLASRGIFDDASARASEHLGGFNSPLGLRTPAGDLVRNPCNSHIRLVTTSHESVSGTVHYTRRPAWARRRHWPVRPGVASALLGGHIA